MGAEAAPPLEMAAGRLQDPARPDGHPGLQGQGRVHRRLRPHAVRGPAEPQRFPQGAPLCPPWGGPPLPHSPLNCAAGAGHAGQQPRVAAGGPARHRHGRELQPVHDVARRVRAGPWQARRSRGPRSHLVWQLAAVHRRQRGGQKRRAAQLFGVLRGPHPDGRSAHAPPAV